MVTYRRRFESSNYNYEWDTSKLCNRCGVQHSEHPNPGKIDRNCDNPRYLRNKNRGCGCLRTPIYEMSQRQREEGDPMWRMDTHCCFCKRATMLVHLETIRINERKHEQCYHCRNMTYVPEKEELYYERRSKVRNSHTPAYDPENNYRSERTNTPVRNIYAEGPTYNPIKEEIDWTNDTEEQIRKKMKFDEPQPKQQTWKEIEQGSRTIYCTTQCQFMDHKKLKDGRIDIFNADTRMIHDTKCCPYGAKEYNDAGIEYDICTCYRKQSKYCFEHDHKTNPCNCEPQVFWEIISFAGSKCKWEQCMDYDEVKHCVHLYCWKHERYTYNQYTKCEMCKQERDIKGDKYWKDLALRCVIQWKNNKIEKEMKFILGMESTNEPIMEDPLQTPTENRQDEIVLSNNEKPLQQMEVDNELEDETVKLQQEITELREQLKQLKVISQDMEEQLKNERNQKEELQEEYKNEKEKVEILARELEKYELTEKVNWEKSTSVFHCKNCKEHEKYYEYCPGSIILYYKMLYESEKIIREEKELDLKQYDGLFKEYERLETERSEENKEQKQESFEEILKMFDELINYDSVENNLYAEELI